MKVKENNTNTFLALVRAGLWEQEARLIPFGKVDYEEVMRLAEEQSVVGLETAGLEHVTDVKVPQEVLLQFIGQTLQIEQQNKAMNQFAESLINRLRENGINALLIKGQGVAQCYEKPLWRSSGDIDLLLDNENYEKAKRLLVPIADAAGNENTVTMHLPITIKGFEVELHGKMPFELSRHADDVVDEVLNSSLCEKGIRVWQLNGTDVLLPNADNDVIIVFMHYLKHFFVEGVGLRQICDWCRLLWSFRDSLDSGLLESRIRKAGLMTEWKVFAALAVNTLGMPVEAMPFYDARFNAKGERALKRVLKTGNFGHNNDLSYVAKYSGARYKIVAIWRRLCDFASLVPMFPVDAPRFFVTYLFGKVK